MKRYVWQTVVLLVALVLPSRRAWADGHYPDYPAEFAEILKRLNSQSLNFSTVVDNASGNFQTDIPGHLVRDDSDSVNDYSFVLLPGRYDSLLVQPTWAGPNITSNGFDCNHCVIVYAVYNKGANGLYSLVAWTYDYATLNAAGTFCDHLYTQTPPGFGDPGGGLPNVAVNQTIASANETVVAVKAWEHNSVAFGHPGTACPDNGCAPGESMIQCAGDPNAKPPIIGDGNKDAACLFKTHLLLVRTGAHPTPPSGPGVAYEHGCPSGYPATALVFDNQSSQCLPYGNWDNSTIVSPRSFKTLDSGWYFAAHCSEHGPENHDYAIGISARTSPSRAHSLLCRASSHHVDGAPSSYHYLSLGRNDPSVTSYNWDTGAVVLAECGFHEVVTGVAQTESNEVDAIACTHSNDVSTGVTPQSCVTYKFNSTTNNCPDGCSVPNDWAPGYIKNQCPSTTYMKGVAKRMNYLPPITPGPSGEIDAILCCNW